MQKIAVLLLAAALLMLAAGCAEDARPAPPGYYGPDDQSSVSNVPPHIYDADP